MATIDVFDQQLKKVGQMTLGPGWDTPISRGSVYESALWQSSRRRAGTASTKGRSEVKGSGRKIYRQKGTGNARHHDRQANLFVGGGIAGGPRSRDWSYDLPKKERKRAIQSVLIQKLKDGKLHVIDSLDFGEVKTKKAYDLFKKWKIESALVLLDEPVENAMKSIRNLASIQAGSAANVNVGDLLLADHIVMTKKALEVVEKRWVQKI